MPQRVMGVWMIVVGVVGLAAAAVLVVFGRDLVRASQTGPRWKRRLIVAALALLSTMGVYHAGGRLIEVKTAAAAEDKTASLTESKLWQRVQATWTEADDAASGRKGAYPFDREGQEALLGALQAREADLDALAAAGLLTAPEAGLLQKDLARLTRGVQGKRPTEMRMATCYKPMMVMPARDSANRLADRLGLLQKLVEAKTLHPAAVMKVMGTVDADLAVLGTEKYLNQLRDEKRTKALDTRKAAAALAETIRARLPKALDLTSTRQWQVIQDAWKSVKPLADSGQSTTAQRKQATEKLKASAQAVAELTKAGALTEAEAGLLTAEAATLRNQMLLNPPTDTQIMCYDMMLILPARQSLQRLTKRLPLLQSIAQKGKVSPAVIGKVLPTIRADLAVLGDEAQASKLNADEHDRAKKLRTEAAAAVVAVEELLKGTK